MKDSYGHYKQKDYPLSTLLRDKLLSTPTNLPPPTQHSFITSLSTFLSQQMRVYTNSFHCQTFTPLLRIQNIYYAHAPITQTILQRIYTHCTFLIHGSVSPESCRPSSHTTPISAHGITRLEIASRLHYESDQVGLARCVWTR